ncbi:hypothetical protein BC835DRAFT_524018 [Cytidiella melzeri]|nr:hypothetical protein BC835DRAFT_524018 [Cytidiella melzeri]
MPIERPPRAARTQTGPANKATSLKYQMQVTEPEFQKFRVSTAYELLSFTHCRLQDVVRNNAQEYLASNERSCDNNAKRVFVENCCEDWPTLRNYRDCWPAAALLKLLLRNTRRGKGRKSTPTARESTGSAEPSQPVLLHASVSKPRMFPQQQDVFEAYLRTIDSTLPSVRMSLVALGIRSIDLLKAFAFLPTRDKWLDSLMRKQLINFKVHQYLRSALSKYCRTSKQTPPRFLSRFRVSAESTHCSSVLPYFLEAIYPRMYHLRIPMETLGIVSANDIRGIIKTYDYAEGLWRAAVDTGLMRPIEGILVLEAFVDLAATDF